jgi:16S rRNA G527 N7-methylase RsmG
MGLSAARCRDSRRRGRGRRGRSRDAGRPDRPEIADVRLVDLVQRRIALVAEIAADLRLVLVAGVQQSGQVGRVQKSRWDVVAARAITAAARGLNFIKFLTETRIY